MYLSSQPHLGKDVCLAVWMPQANICQCNYSLLQLELYKTCNMDTKAEILAYTYLIFIL